MQLWVVALTYKISSIFMRKVHLIIFFGMKRGLMITHVSAPCIKPCPCQLFRYLPYFNFLVPDLLGTNQPEFSCLYLRATMCQWEQSIRSTLKCPFRQQMRHFNSVHYIITKQNQLIKIMIFKSRYASWTTSQRNFYQVIATRMRFELFVFFPCYSISADGRLHLANNIGLCASLFN